MMKKILVVYFLSLVFLTFFSYGYVDPNLTLSSHPGYQQLQAFFHHLAFKNRPLATLIFLLFWLAGFGFYGFFLAAAKKKKIDVFFFRKLIATVVLGTFFAYPFLSNDIFNYMFTARILTVYRENPYLVMPQEFLGDPWLSFLHWSNRTALYGPTWLLLTLIPSFLAGSRILVSLFAFKGLVVVFYLGTIFILTKLLDLTKTKNKFFALVFFALNPLLVWETLVSGHNDIVLVFFGLLAFYFLTKNRKLFSLGSLFFSILIKFATLFLLPVFSWAAWQRIRKKKIDWKLVFTWASWSMFLVYFFSPLREELYPWYLIWVLPWAALSLANSLLVWLALAFSAGTILRYAPFLYTGSWGGITPQIKLGVTVVPVILVLARFGFKGLVLRKK